MLCESDLMLLHDPPHVLLLLAVPLAVHVEHQQTQQDEEEQNSTHCCCDGGACTVGLPWR